MVRAIFDQIIDNLVDTLVKEREEVIWTEFEKLGYQRSQILEHPEQFCLIRVGEWDMFCLADGKELFGVRTTCEPLSVCKYEMKIEVCELGNQFLKEGE